MLLLEQARACLASGHAAQAVTLLQQLLESVPDSAEALELLGNTLMAQGESVTGARYLCKAYVLQPAHQQQPRMRALACYILGDLQQARNIYRDWVAAEPNNAVARHYLAALSGEAVPARASDAYIVATFDAFADRFEHDLQNLGYRIPQEMALLLAQHQPPQAHWKILDGGCGTGLVGHSLQPWARELHGVDLSANMVAHARASGRYTQLDTMELGAYLAQSTTLFDLIALADTLMYFGELDVVLQRSAARLTANGWLLFNTELAQPSDGPLRLHASGRYQHSAAYVARCLHDAGLVVVANVACTIRQELDQAIAGQLVLARKMGASRN